MNLVAFDTETHQVQPGLVSPPLVVASYAESAYDRSYLEPPRGASMQLARVMGRKEWPTLVGANIAYDMAVMLVHDPSAITRIFNWYREGRVYDVQIAQALDAIAKGHLFIDPRTGKQVQDPHTKKYGRYSLAVCVKLELKRDDAKANAFWQRRYAYLEKLPFDQWPEEARQYPIDDAKNTLEVAQAQLKRGAKNLQAMPREAYVGFTRHLGAVWGLRTDAEKVEQLASEVESAHQGYVDKFTEVGFFRPDGSEDQRALKSAVALAYGCQERCQVCSGAGTVPDPKKVAINAERERTGVKRRLKEPPVACKACDATGYDLETAPVPRTEKDAVSTSRDTLVESGDESLMDYADNVHEKIRTTYIPFLRQGVKYPLNLRPNVLVSSFRMSYDGPIQQMPRSGGVRECFKARDGYVYCSCDYSSIELCTLAQAQIWVCGSSRMAEVINEGKDLHAAFGAAMAGLSYDEFRARLKAGDKACKGFRQAAKAANFGFPGGMSAVTLVLAKRKEGLRFCKTLLDKPCASKVITWGEGWKQQDIPPTCWRCLELAEKLRDDWFEQWPEMPEYFEKAKYVAKTTGAREILGDIRGGMDFCTAANDWFQRLAAIGLKKADIAVTEECYLEELGSPLLGTRVPIAVHDELLMEMPEETAHLAGPRAAELMVREMHEDTERGPACTPDVKPKVDPALMRWWNKDAESAYSGRGKLIPWEDREAA